MGMWAGSETLQKRRRRPLQNWRSKVYFGQGLGWLRALLLTLPDKWGECGLRLGISRQWMRGHFLWGAKDDKHCLRQNFHFLWGAKDDKHCLRQNFHFLWRAKDDKHCLRQNFHFLWTAKDNKHCLRQNFHFLWGAKGDKHCLRQNFQFQLRNSGLTVNIARCIFNAIDGTLWVQIVYIQWMWTAVHDTFCTAIILQFMKSTK